MDLGNLAKFFLAVGIGDFLVGEFVGRSVLVGGSLEGVLMGFWDFGDVLINPGFTSFLLVRARTVICCPEKSFLFREMVSCDRSRNFSARSIFLGSATESSGVRAENRPWGVLSCWGAGSRLCDAASVGLRECLTEQIRVEHSGLDLQTSVGLRGRQKPETRMSSGEARLVSPAVSGVSLIGNCGRAQGETRMFSGEAT